MPRLDRVKRGNLGHRGHLLPVSTDLEDFTMLPAGTPLPGQVPAHHYPHGPPGVSPVPLQLPLQTAISPILWVDKSILQPAAGNSLFAWFVKGSSPPRGYALSCYFGVTNVAAGQSCQDFVASHEGSEYIIINHSATLAVQGSLECPAAYSNEGFEAWNSALWYDRHDPGFFLCLRGEPLEEVVYEISTNYGTKGEPSDFWTPARRASLDPTTRAICDAYYPPTTPSVQSGTVGDCPNPLSTEESQVLAQDEEEAPDKTEFFPPAATVPRTVQLQLHSYMYSNDKTG